MLDSRATHLAQCSIELCSELSELENLRLRIREAERRIVSAPVSRPAKRNLISARVPTGDARTSSPFRKVVIAAGQDSAVISSPPTFTAGIGALVFAPKLRMRSPMLSTLPFPVDSRFTASL